MKKLQLGVIGVGSVVREIYQHLYFHSDYADNLDIVAVAEPNDAQRAWFCDTYDIPESARFTDYHDMLERCALDAVHVNTPDSLHEEPTIAALDRGLDVLLPKPLSDRIDAAHRMREAARRNDRLIGVDFHKRGDPRVVEAAHRYRAGRYGEFQHADWHMIDRLLVVDPNHEPPFFASADFAEKNSPISFLTVHMADSFMQVVGLRPTAVRATAWSQKLPALKPKSVNGYDLCETEVVFENHGVARFVTGWHWPNTAPGLSNEWTRTICTDGVLEIMYSAGLRDIAHDGVTDPNILFQTTQSNGKVTGFGMSVPGDLLNQFIGRRDNAITDAARHDMLDPMTLGFWSSVIVEAAHESLHRGRTSDNGVTRGVELSVNDLLNERLGDDAATYRV